MTSNRLFMTRTILMGATGLICALYAVLALVMGRPDPFPFWIPGLVGFAAWLTIWKAAGLAGPDVAGQSFDEGFRADNLHAQAFAFWVAVWMYPVFGFLLWQGVVEGPVAFASMGCLTAASYLLGLIWRDIKGRG